MSKKELITIEVPVWWKPGGGMMYKRECLPADHPESEYNYIKRTYGVNPVDYGIESPETVCQSCGKSKDLDYGKWDE